MYIYFSETLLYLALAFTGGCLLLSFIPKAAKPATGQLWDVFQYALIAIPLFSLMPLLRTTFILRDFAGDLTTFQILLIVLKDYSAGNAWLWMLCISTAMYALTLITNLEKKSVRIFLSAMWASILLAHGFASHPASLSWIAGLLSQFFHVGAMSVWLGILIIVAWFTKGNWNWKAFLSWYTPLAISSMAVIFTAGICMMFIIMDDKYLNSWSGNYGQALLLKHLVFVPLLLLGFMNGFLTKISQEGMLRKKLQWWLRLESFLALSILFITAFLGVQEPPHEEEFEQPQPSVLLKYLHGQLTDTVIQWSFNSLGSLLIAIGTIALGGLYVCYRKNRKWLFVICLSSSILCLFLGLLLSVR